MIFWVTSEHILYGDQRDCSTCPVALAIRDLFPRSHVTVTYHDVQVDGHRVDLPPLPYTV
jgi:hypothetical protein